MEKNIKVNLGERSYGVFIQNGLLKNRSFLKVKLTGFNQVALLTSPRIFELYGRKLENALKNKRLKINKILVPEGEKNKNQDTLWYILRKMGEAGFQRDSCLLALGGGVVGDIGGLAASLYMRGIAFVQCPTTFLAQVDASIGGKTAIDFMGVKNLIGAFYQPKMVLIDTDTLQTIDDRQFRTGLAEVIKYGVISGEKLFGKIEGKLGRILSRNPVEVSELVRESCEIKSKIVSSDEKENGKRAWLNYGHTLGHALEAHFNYELLTHGEAIAYGMWFAASLSHRLGLCEKSVLDRQFKLLEKAGLFLKLPPYNPGDIYRKMVLDKKARKGQVQFVLTRKIGLVTIQKNIPQSTILSALTRLQAEASELQ